MGLVVWDAPSFWDRARVLGVVARDAPSLWDRVHVFGLGGARRTVALFAQLFWTILWAWAWRRKMRRLSETERASLGLAAQDAPLFLD